MSNYLFINDNILYRYLDTNITEINNNVSNIIDINKLNNNKFITVDGSGILELYDKTFQTKSVIENNSLESEKIIKIDQLKDSNKTLIFLTDKSNFYIKNTLNGPLEKKISAVGTRIFTSFCVDIYGKLIMNNSEGNFYILNTGNSKNVLTNSISKYNLIKMKMVFSKLQVTNSNILYGLNKTDKHLYTTYSDSDDKLLFKKHDENRIMTTFFILLNDVIFLQSFTGFYGEKDSNNTIIFNTVIPDKLSTRNKFKITDHLSHYTITNNNDYCNNINCASTNQSYAFNFEDNKIFDATGNSCKVDFLSKYFICNSSAIENDLSKFNLVPVNIDAPMTCEYVTEYNEKINIVNELLRKNHTELSAYYNTLNANLINQLNANRYKRDTEGYLVLDKQSTVDEYGNERSCNIVFGTTKDERGNIINKAWPGSDECWRFPYFVKACCYEKKYTNMPCYQGPDNTHCFQNHPQYPPDSHNIPNAFTFNEYRNNQNKFGISQIKKLQTNRLDNWLNSENLRINALISENNAKLNELGPSPYQFETMKISCCQEIIYEHISASNLEISGSNTCTIINDNDDDKDDKDDKTKDDKTKEINLNPFNINVNPLGVPLTDNDIIIIIIIAIIVAISCTALIGYYLRTKTPQIPTKVQQAPPVSSFGEKNIFKYKWV